MSLKMSAMEVIGFKINNKEYLKIIFNFNYKDKEYLIKLDKIYFEHHVSIVTKEAFNIIIMNKNKIIDNLLKEKIIKDLNIDLIVKNRDYKYSY